MAEPTIRPIDRCRWQPWAYINDHGMPVPEMTTALFIRVVGPARHAIISAMESAQRGNNRPR